MFCIYMKEVWGISGFPVDLCNKINICNKIVILNRDFLVKKYDASMRYFVLKFDEIGFFVQVIEAICELLF